METDLGIDRLLFVKIPVTDVAASARWYARLLEMRLAMEFIEDDELRGVVLIEPATGSRLALRDRAYSLAWLALALVGWLDPKALNRVSSVTSVVGPLVNKRGG